MTTLLEHPSVQALVTRMSVADYHKLGELGLLPEKIELIDGVLINKMPKFPKQNFSNQFYCPFRTAYLYKKIGTRA